MIQSIVTKESIFENFKLVIESAKSTYSENNLHSTMLESLDIDSDREFITSDCDELDEAINVTDPKIVKEKKGTAISVKINGTEYRYVSATKSTSELYRSFMGQLKYAQAGYKAINWLKKNALEYYGSKNPSEEGRKLVGFNESEEVVKLEATQPGDIPPARSDEDEDIKKPLTESVYGKDIIRTDKSGMSYYDDFLNPKDHDYKRLVKGLQGTVKMMPPSEYINRLAREIFHCTRERVMRGVDWDNVKKIEAKMAAGTKYDIPVLDLANQTQEGRHRAVAAEDLGCAQIPVLVVTKWDAKKELNMPDCMKLFYGHTIQWTKKDGTEAELHVGLDLEKVREAISKIVKSGDYKK